MISDDALRAAAQALGIQQQFQDVFGHPHATTPESNRAILAALGVRFESEDELKKWVARREELSWDAPIPAVIVANAGATVTVPVRSLARVDSVELKVSLEDGSRQSFTIDLAGIPATARHLRGQAIYVERPVQLPAAIPAGYHEISIAENRARLIVTPSKALTPQRRYAGFGITLWGLRSKRNWGCGDFRDLRDLVDWSRETLRVDFVALNPLHAIHNRSPYNVSPYLPLSVFWRNWLYIDCESVAGYEAIRNKFETAETATELDSLRATDLVSYERVAALKQRALRMIFATEPPPAQCMEWIRKQGESLRLFTTYCALDADLHEQNPDLWIWTDWPTAFQDPKSDAVREFAASHAAEILFHGWLQWLIDQQLGEVQRHALSQGMEIGLYHDLALATDRCGADLWAWREFYIPGARVGAPPDDFAPEGQDWSFPPPNREQHFADGYKLFAESIRRTMCHGGALRIDHVMRLFRLYWIPDEHKASEGAYVSERAEYLVPVLALESVRNNAVVIGEDLGTVEGSIREVLAKRGILSYRLLWFEQYNDRFSRPEEYPEQSLSSTTTNDLATIAGFWSGADIEARLQAGTADRAAYEHQWNARRKDRQKLLDTFFELKLLPGEHERQADQIPVLTPDLHSAFCGYVAQTKSAMWLINQEDMTKERFQQNLPATTSEYPNWQRKMRWSLQDLTTDTEALGCSAMLRIWIERSGRA